jgi:hypothetical protein
LIENDGISGYDVFALDAMGVIYQACDDVAELLSPFIAARRSSTDCELVERTYLRAGLGDVTSIDFWRAVGIGPSLEGRPESGRRLP